MFSQLRNFDAYPKTLDDFRIKTFGGGTVTIISSILMTILFISEMNFYLSKETQQELFVDTGSGHKLKINVDVSFHKVGCSYLSLDAMDISGEQQLDIVHHIMKQRLDSDGVPVAKKAVLGELGDEDSKNVPELVTEKLAEDRCESCYGAETSVKYKCCNTCQDVRDAYRQKGWALNEAIEIEQCKREGWSQRLNSEIGEGCRIYGYLEVNKVAGNFHIAPGKSFQQHHIHVHDMQGMGDKKKFDLSHKFNHLSFGAEFPGQVNALDHYSHILETEDSVMFQYYAKVVPTTYIDVHNEMTVTSQYSITKHKKILTNDNPLESSGLPGIFITYELSPIMVKYTEKHRSFMHFLTGVCAIIGGVFTVAGLIDSFIYHSTCAIQKKIDLGKAT